MTPWTFLAVADMQPGSPRSFRYQAGWAENWQITRAQLAREQADLILVAGDMTRDGNIHRFEMEELKRELDELPFPWHAVAGNMDTGNKAADRDGPERPERERDTALTVTSEQCLQYAEFFGPLWWSFVHKQVRFSGLANMLCGTGLPEEEAQWRWLEAQARQPRCPHHVWLMHYPLFVERPDEPTWDISDPAQYLDWYFSLDQPHRGRLLDALKAAGATIVISGHIHCRRHARFDGIDFDYAPGCAFSQYGHRWPGCDPTLGYLRYHVSDSGIARTFVPLERVSGRKDGYGIGGHPRPELRDYSLAWEKPG